MLPLQTSEAKGAITSVFSSLDRCWRHANLLRGLHEGAIKFSEAFNVHNGVLQQIWSATFEALIVSIGSLIERKDKCISIGNAVFTIEREGNEKAREVAKALRSKIDSKNGAVHKLRLWRNHAIAHISKSGIQQTFYLDNPLFISEIEFELAELELMLNDLALAQIGVTHSSQAASNSLIEEAKVMVLALAMDARNNPSMTCPQ